MVSFPALTNTHARIGLLAVSLLLSSACDMTRPTRPGVEIVAGLPANTVQLLDCTADVSSGSVSCAPLLPSSGSVSTALASSPRFAATVVGRQGDYLVLSSTNISSAGGIFQFDVTIQNLLPEAMGTYDGVTPDSAGIRVFFRSGPTVTAGTGTISVANADGISFFTGSAQPYFQYNEVLGTNQVSSPRTWQLAYDPGVVSFEFSVAVYTELQPLLVINEVMVNPAGTGSTETSADWVELYNAGRFPVDLQGLVIADSAASGRRPYHRIASSVVVYPGSYVVLGTTTNLNDNLGVPVDYAWGGAVALASSLDAFKISRVVGTDTLTLDRTWYGSPSISAVDGVSRELKNPTLDNVHMDGSNWSSASVTSVYGAGGRGTPKAQNSSYTP
jgi:hypothetical protein